MTNEATLLKIHKDIAVLLKSSKRVERQLERQNGQLREDHTMIVKHEAQIESIEGHVAENRDSIVKVDERVRALGLSNAKLSALIGGGTTVGAALGYALGLVLKLFGT